MAARSGSLGSILILSAIDVLLCGFSAALALFFVGAGAGVTGNAVGSASMGIGIGADVDARGNGAPAGIVIAHYDGSSATLRPENGSHYETIPALGWESATDVTWLLNEVPTAKKPFILVRGDNLGPVSVRLRISVLGATSIASWSCGSGNGVVEIRVSSTGTEAGRGLCQVR